MNRWATYRQAAEEREEVIRDRLFNSNIDEEKHEESLDYIYGLIEKDNSDEYLVDGAVLWCEKATQKPVQVEGLKYYANRDGTSQLRVKHQSSIGEKDNALITDCKKDENIFSFGNCTLPLSEEDKEKLKKNAKSQIRGTCHCLMNPDRVWDEYPRFGLSAYSYDDIRAITMNAGLFCKRGAWILPITSGQEKDYIKNIYNLTEEEIEFLYRHQLPAWAGMVLREYPLKEEQLVIFNEIEEYFENYDELQKGNVIFAFEGLGSYSGTTNSYHPEGQFGAIFISCRDMEILYITDNCSTLPDYPNDATIEDGVYPAVHVLHNGQYQAIQLWTSNSNYGISSCFHPLPDYQAMYRLEYGINMHAAGDIVEKTDKPWSEGCLTIADEDYYSFSSTAGFVAMVENGEEIDTYDEIKENLNEPFKERESPWGYVVVNREYMDASQREKFLTGYEERTKD